MDGRIPNCPCSLLPGTTLMPIACGPRSGSQPRPNGRRLRVGLTAGYFHGATNGTSSVLPRDGQMATRNLKSRCQWAPFLMEPVRMESRTWRGMSANGSPISTFLITIVLHPRRTRKALSADVVSAGVVRSLNQREIYARATEALLHALRV